MQIVSDLDELRVLLAEADSLSGVVVQNLDLRPVADEIANVEVVGSVFLGCELETGCLSSVVRRGGVVFPEFGDYPFDPYRAGLYRAEDLFDGFDPTEPCTYCDALDARVWRHWRDHGKGRPESLVDALAQRLHDHSIAESMYALLEHHERVVAVMGGHGLLRSDPRYRDVVIMSQRLAERGYFLASGGGPGAMEATHVGVWFAGHPESEIDAAIELLSRAPRYDHAEFLSRAFEVRERWDYAASCPESLGVPTWLYGHEPPNPFPTHIAKYFANSVREDGLVSIATHGIVYAPGSAGTIQEIFQDAAQNHYGVVDGKASAMVFLDETYWTQTKPVYPLLANVAKDEVYGSMMAIGDDIDTLIAFLESHPPQALEKSGWNVCGLHCGKG